MLYSIAESSAYLLLFQNTLWPIYSAPSPTRKGRCLPAALTTRIQAHAHLWFKGQVAIAPSWQHRPSLITTEPELGMFSEVSWPQIVWELLWHFKIPDLGCPELWTFIHSSVYKWTEVLCSKNILSALSCNVIDRSWSILTIWDLINHSIFRIDTKPKYGIWLQNLYKENSFLWYPFLRWK